MTKEQAMNRKSLVLCAAILAAILAAPARSPAAATASTTAQITSQLKEAKKASYELRTNAERLAAITRGISHSWQSHSQSLNEAREHVNRLGQMLVDLEELKPHASQPQQMAIESMRPRLAQMANALTSAIELVSDGSNNIRFSPYGDAVESVTEHSTSLHQTLDTVLKYEAAKAQFDGLELEAATQLVR